MDVNVALQDEINKEKLHDLSANWTYTSLGYFSFEPTNAIFFDFLFSASSQNFSMGKGAGALGYVHSFSCGDVTTNKVTLYDTKSQKIKEIVVKHKCHNLFIHVLPNDDLVVVTDDGYVFVYNRGILISTVNITLEENEIIIMTGFSDVNVAFLTSNGNIYDIDNFQKIEKLKMIVINDTIKEMFVIPKKNSKLKMTILYILDNSGILKIISKDFGYDIKLNKKILNVGLSENYNFLAFIDEDLKVSVGTFDLSNIIYEKETQPSEFEKVINICWIGDMFPVVCFVGGVAAIINDSEGLTFWPIESDNDASFGFTDCDSCFISTCRQNYILKYLPQNVTEIFTSYNIFDSGSFLINIYSNRKNEPAIQQLGKINIEEAVKEILNAVEYISDQSAQSLLLNSVCFGLSYRRQLNLNNLFIESLSRLRILNYIHSTTGIPITNKQIYSIGINSVIERLMNREFHFVAVKISSLIGKPFNYIINDYIDLVIRTVSNDSTCFKLLSENKNIDYYYAALSAINAGRESLALELCSLEPIFSKKAKIYAKLNYWKEAFQNIVLCCDTSALYEVLIQALSQKDQDLICPAITSSEISCRFLMDNLNLIDRNYIEKVFKEIKINFNYYDVRLRYNIKNNPNFICFESLLPLKNFQTYVNSQNSQAMVGPTLNETIRRLIFNLKEEEAYKLAESCGLSKRNVMILSIKYYAKQKQWDKLNQIASDKKNKDLWSLILELISANTKDNKIINEFLNTISNIDLKKSQAFRNQLDNNEYTPSMLLQKNSYNSNLFSSSLFHRIKSTF